MSDWDDCGHHPEWVNKFDRTNTCNHPDHGQREAAAATSPVDTEALRKVADFQDFAEHADLILAAALALDDFELAASSRESIRWPTSDDEIHALLLEVERLRATAFACEARPPASGHESLSTTVKTYGPA